MPEPATIAPHVGDLGVSSPNREDSSVANAADGAAPVVAGVEASKGGDLGVKEISAEAAMDADLAADAAVREESTKEAGDFSHSKDKSLPQSPPVSPVSAPGTNLWFLTSKASFRY